MSDEVSRVSSFHLHEDEKARKAVDDGRSEPPKVRDGADHRGDATLVDFTEEGPHPTHRARMV